MKISDLLILVAFVIIAILSAFELFSANSQARRFGGTEQIMLPVDQKLIQATWKNSDLWYLYRPMRVGEIPETFYFVEDSALGIMEGTVIFVETRSTY